MISIAQDKVVVIESAENSDEETRYKMDDDL